MELMVKERLQLLSVLPPAGDITTVRIVRELRESLSFTEAEHKEFEIVTVREDGLDKTRWNAEKVRTVDIAMGEKAFDVIAAALKRASTAHKLPVEMIELYERFIAA